MLSVESVRYAMSEGSLLFMNTFSKGYEIGGHAVRSLMENSGPYLGKITKAASESFAFLAASFSKVCQTEGILQGRQFVALPLGLGIMAAFGYFFSQQNASPSQEQSSSQPAAQPAAQPDPLVEAVRI